jgi:hypothetical protein
MRGSSSLLAAVVRHAGQPRKGVNYRATQDTEKEKVRKN